MDTETFSRLRDVLATLWESCRWELVILLGVLVACLATLRFAG